MTLADRSRVRKVMESLGFNQDRSRLFVHPNSKFLVEFPGSAVRIGEELITEFNELKLPVGALKLLTPTDSIKDRLAAYIHWKDKQGLDQAVWIAEAQEVDLDSIRKWAIAEGGKREHMDFERMLGRGRARKD